MNKEEAIQILSTRDAHGVLCGYTSGVTEALDMAIEALSEDRPYTHKEEWEMCDLISRADAIGAWDKLSKRGRTEFDQVLMTLPSAKAEWIPVSERLPKEDGEYIVTMGKDGFDKEGDVTWAMFNKLEKRFYFPAGKVKYYIAVIAWQPRPKPYKGGDAK